jgi:hypothetical protein
VVEQLPSKCEAFSSSPSTAKKKKRKKERIRMDKTLSLESRMTTDPWLVMRGHYWDGDPWRKSKHAERSESSILDTLCVKGQGIYKWRHPVGTTGLEVQWLTQWKWCSKGLCYLLGLYSNIPWVGWAKQQIYFLRIWRPKVQDHRCQQGWFLRPFSLAWRL